MRSLSFVFMLGLAVACGTYGEDDEVTPAPPVSNDGGTDSSDAGSIDPESGPPARPRPFHVDVELDDTAADLGGAEVIDTNARKIVPAPGRTIGAFRFEDHGGIAVLFVGRWDVDEAVEIVGDHPLIVVASKAVDVRAYIDAAATKDTPGPGGNGAGKGPGAGAAATRVAAEDPGGGGAGFGAVGAAGGSANGAAGGAGGTIYGDSIRDFLGGSGGGSGSPFGSTNCAGKTGGGAGGGAFQITSAISITVSRDGAIDVGGGGGLGGCLDGSDGTTSGGGGGSGGTLFLEAPRIDVTGALLANGGGGGGGAAYAASTIGQPGADALTTTKPAGGGSGGTTDRRGGSGGSLDAPAQTPAGIVNQAGGGGGGVGRIWLRTRKAPAVVDAAAVVSPAASVDTNF